MPLSLLLLLAVIQGLTEFIPVSSSAHLILPAALIEGFADQGTAVDVAAHLGSLGAVMLYFRAEMGQLARGGIGVMRGRRGGEERLFLLLALATIPFLLAGAMLAFSGHADLLRDPVVIAWASIGFGLLLFLSDRKPARIDTLPSSMRQAVLIGLAQCLALIPGTSRSGITITAARFLGFDRTQAARFSMLLSIPTIAAAGGFLALDLGESGAAALGPAAIVAALSFLSAYAAIALFLRLTRSVSFLPFVLYRIALGGILLAIFT